MVIQKSTKHKMLQDSLVEHKVPIASRKFMVSKLSVWIDVKKLVK